MVKKFSELYNTLSPESKRWAENQVKEEEKKWLSPNCAKRGR